MDRDLVVPQLSDLFGPLLPLGGSREAGGLQTAFRTLVFQTSAGDVYIHVHGDLYQRFFNATDG